MAPKERFAEPRSRSSRNTRPWRKMRSRPETESALKISSSTPSIITVWLRPMAGISGGNARTVNSLNSRSRLNSRSILSSRSSASSKNIIQAEGKSERQAPSLNPRRRQAMKRQQTRPRSTLPRLPDRHSRYTVPFTSFRYPESQRTRIVRARARKGRGRARPCCAAAGPHIGGGCVTTRHPAAGLA